MEVSIPQSEFCPLGQPKIWPIALPTPLVSIPQSEFCPLGRALAPGDRDQTELFQFLSRNSVRWDKDNQ